MIGMVFVFLVIDLIITVIVLIAFMRSSQISRMEDE